MPNTPKLPDWEKSIKSLHATTTGAITIKLYRDGKVYVSYGGNTIEDVILQIVELVSQELSTLKAQVRKEIEGKLEAVGLCENTKKDSSWCNKCRECHLRGSDLNLGREEAFEDCLSIPSLKGEE